MMNKPKRIISFILHDSGRQFACLGAPDAVTPNIDALAADGVLFENHFTTGTVCVPSRASILTGKYMHNTEICFNKTGVTTIPRLMRRAGYTCVRAGFQEEREYRGIAGQNYTGVDFNTLGCRILGYDMSYTARRDAAGVADYVIKTLSDRPDGNFYISAAFTEAHAPYILPVSEEDIEAAHIPDALPQIPPVRAAKTMLARLSKAVTAADTAIGRVRDFLKEHDMDGDTVISVTTDHGIDFPRAKQSCYDMGTGVLWLLSGAPLGMKGVRFAGLTSHVDILPTFCELAGVLPPGDSDGESRLSLKGREYCISETAWDNTYLPMRALRTERYRYIMNFNPGYPPATGNDFTRDVGAELLTGIYSQPRPAEELFDARLDPAMLENLAYLPEYREIKLELRARLLEKLAADGDEVLCAGSVYSRQHTAPGYSDWKESDDGSFRLVPRK